MTGMSLKVSSLDFGEESPVLEMNKEGGKPWQTRLESSDPTALIGNSDSVDRLVVLYRQHVARVVVTYANVVSVSEFHNQNGLM
ncbi:hypothetical protein GOBAR_DD05174 [Gossypium barbadense]|nr:hypothetical protein GOBAR_DD05174 [Gossypium barbadense]